MAGSIIDGHTTHYDDEMIRSARMTQREAPVCLMTQRMQNVEHNLRSKQQLLISEAYVAWKICIQRYDGFDQRFYDVAMASTDVKIWL